MAAMDEFREEREAVKNGPLKGRIAYFWDYYKWHTIIALFVLFLIGSTIYNKMTEKESAIHGILLNAFDYNTEDKETNLIDDFLKDQKLDPKEYTVTINSALGYVADSDSDSMASNYNTMQALNAVAGAGELDFVTGTFTGMQDLAHKGLFVDLRTILTDEEIKKYEPYFLYMDQAVIEKKEEAFDKIEDVSSIEIPDCTKPDTMEKPIPVMIDVSKCQKLITAYGYEPESLAFGITPNAPHTKRALRFLDYLWTP